MWVIQWTAQYYLDKWMCFSVNWPLPWVSSLHSLFSITSTPSPSPDCSKLCLAIIYNWPIWYWNMNYIDKPFLIELLGLFCIKNIRKHSFLLSQNSSELVTVEGTIDTSRKRKKKRNSYEWKLPLQRLTACRCDTPWTAPSRQTVFPVLSHDLNGKRSENLCTPQGNETSWFLTAHTRKDEENDNRC